MDVFGSFSDCFRIVFGSFSDGFRLFSDRFGSFSDRFRTVFGSFSDRFGSFSDCFWIEIAKKSITKFSNEMPLRAFVIASGRRSIWLVDVR